MVSWRSLYKIRKTERRLNGALSTLRHELRAKKAPDEDVHFERIDMAVDKLLMPTLHRLRDQPPHSPPDDRIRGSRLGIDR